MIKFRVVPYINIRRQAGEGKVNLLNKVRYLLHDFEPILIGSPPISPHKV